MPNFFISYRRDDSAGHVGRLYDRLTAHFGANCIFMDIDTIEPGTDFIKIINNAINQCDIMLVVIGKRWLTITDATGKRRLDSPQDLVRLEVQAGLARDILIIPLLVGGAEMPSSRNLPGTLVTLARRNAFELRDNNWHADVNNLIDIAEKMASNRKLPSSKSSIQKNEPIRIYTDVMRWFGSFGFGLDNGDFFVYIDRFEFKSRTRDIHIIMPFDEITDINVESVAVHITVGSQEYQFNRSHFGNNDEVTSKIFFDYMNGAT